MGALVLKKYYVSLCQRTETVKLKTKLYEYLLFPISKKEFLIVLEQIVMAVQKLQANSMSISNLVMEVYKVYINRNTKEMQFLYTGNE